MGLALFKEKRLSDRRKLTGLLPGRLLIAGDRRQDVFCRPVDVSANGVGIVLAREIAAGTDMVLMLPDREVSLRVAWGQPDFGKQDMFRYGLATLDAEDNLEEIFVAAGCLK